MAQSSSQETSTKPTQQERSRLLFFLGQLLSVAGLLVAAISLPWATARFPELGVTLEVHPGGLGVALGLVGVALGGLATASFLHSARMLSWLFLLGSLLGLVLATAAALHSVSAANHLADRALASSDTSYGPGSTLAGVASVALLAIALLGLQRTGCPQTRDVRLGDDRPSAGLSRG